MSKREPIVYSILFLILATIIGWQTIEHTRVRKAARSALTDRARDITSTLGVVIRSQRFFMFVDPRRLESALSELVKSEDLVSVALLNASGDVVASAGSPVDLASAGTQTPGERWSNRMITIVNPVDLGSAISAEGTTNNTSQPTVVIGPEDRGRIFSIGRSRGETSRTNATEQGSEPEHRRGRFDRDWDRERDPDRDRSRSREGGERERRGRPPPPPWMAGERFQALMQDPEFQAVVEKQGLHGLALVLSTDHYRATCANDLWIRSLIAFFGLVSVVGIGFAWRNLARSSDFEIRLLRASELNSHLREMNVAAAGLAHETRNPLNIIRGLAQMISKNSAAPPALKENASRITSEVDLVTAQLNEFINYSKPRELRRTAVDLRQVITEVVRALQTDLEDKEIKLSTADDSIAIDADERLLRQVIFNLLINAIQAVDQGGEINVDIKRFNGQDAAIEVRDNGPGVAPEHRAEIFRPYFTTHQKGTGLGLAVVRQIVLAHGWDIEYQPNDNKGAIFRVRGMRVVPK